MAAVTAVAVAAVIMAVGTVVAVTGIISAAGIMAVGTFTAVGIAAHSPPIARSPRIA